MILSLNSCRGNETGVLTDLLVTQDANECIQMLGNLVNLITLEIHIIIVLLWISEHMHSKCR